MRLRLAVLLAARPEPADSRATRGHALHRNAHLEDARLAILADYLQRRAARPENLTAVALQAERGLRAVALAPTLDICRALLRGEHVRVERLDPAGIARHQLRPDDKAA